MGEWLSTYSWDWWCTLTFRNEYTPDAATRAFLRFASWLRHDSPGVGYFVGHEVGRLGRLHLHALIGGLEPHVQRTAAARRWERRHGHARIFPYDRDRGAAHYIAKYVSKELAEWDIHAVGTPRPSLFDGRHPTLSQQHPGCLSTASQLPAGCLSTARGQPLNPGGATHKYPEKAYMGTAGGRKSIRRPHPNDTHRTGLSDIHAGARARVAIPDPDPEALTKKPEVNTMVYNG